MPKFVVSPLIYEGHFEWYLRFSLHKEAKDMYPECADFKVYNNNIYYACFYAKKQYTLEDVEKIRDDKVKFYEEAGLRKTKLGRSWTTQRLRTTTNY